MAIGRLHVGVTAVALVGGCLSSTPPVQSTSTSSSEGSSGGGIEDASSAAADGSAASESSTTASGDAPEGTNAPVDCTGTTLRVATFNVHSLDPTGSDEFEALQAILQRIGADVVCMQEVLPTEGTELEVLAERLGYMRFTQADESPAIGGDLTNACMARTTLGLVGSYTARDLSSDHDANDVGRDILVVRASPSRECGFGLVTVHLKSGRETTDLFRRGVEVERLLQAATRFRDYYPDDPVIALGDFNQDIGEVAELGLQFSAPPAGLPSSYALGSDIRLPLVYDPFVRMANVGFTRVDPRWEDSNIDFTWDERARLDYVFLAGAEATRAVVYNACRDNGVDDDPPGGFVPFEGKTPPCPSSRIASDHMPVVVDVEWK